MTGKFRADQVGSLLRPEALLAARRGHDAGEVTDAGLREAEDQAEGGNLLTEAEQYAKLALVADVARSVWGHEGPND